MYAMLLHIKIKTNITKTFHFLCILFWIKIFCFRKLETKTASEKKKIKAINDEDSEEEEEGTKISEEFGAGSHNSYFVTKVLNYYCKQMLSQHVSLKVR